MHDKNLLSGFNELRRRAEEMLQNREATADPADIDILALIHELEVHQIELQMQNEELLQARSEAEESRKEYADLYDFAPIGYVTTNHEGVIVRANLVASKMLNVSRKRLINRGFSNFIHYEDHKDYFSLVQDIVDRRAMKSTGEFRLLRNNATPFYAQVEVATSRDGKGEFTGWRIAFLDVSDRRRYAEELERSNHELQDFAFIASHDLQEPLRKIITFSHMVMKNCENILNETNSDYLRRVQGAATRMQELLRALLQYSRVGTESKPFTECNLNKTVEDVVSDLELFVQRTGGKIEVSDLPVIQADTAQIRQLFQNLLSNALKFHKNDVPPVVKVYSLPCDGKICSIAVEDNGIGFEEEYIEKIFAPFQRLHGRSSQYEGTGMGLAICRKIINRHHGSLIARGVPGQGSIFILSLPCIQPD